MMDCREGHTCLHWSTSQTRTREVHEIVMKIRTERSYLLDLDEMLSHKEIDLSPVFPPPPMYLEPGSETLNILIFEALVIGAFAAYFSSPLSHIVRQ